MMLSLAFNLTSLMANQAPALIEEEKGALTEEEQGLITDRDRGSRERPNLYDYNRQNVQYNRRFEGNNYQSGYSQSGGRDNYEYYYNQPASSTDTFNQSNYLDNTSPNFYFNQ